MPNLQVESLLEKRHVYRYAHGDSASGQSITHLIRINSAQVTLMKTSVCLDPVSGSVQKEESH